MFYFLLSVVTPPDLDKLTNGDLFDIIENFISFIYDFFNNAYYALIQFYDLIIEVNSYVNTLVDSASSGNIQGLPLLEIIGAYRYLVTDPIFYLTYVLIVSGCFFTIYKLFLLIRASITEFKISILAKGNTSTGYISLLKQLFHL